MGNYRRWYERGATYFITQVTYQQQPWLCTDAGRSALRQAITHVRQNHPFAIAAFVLMPDHFHALLTLPEGDSDFSTRMRLIKRYVTRYHKHELGLQAISTRSRLHRQEQNLWQRRFWEHLIRDEADFDRCYHYIHHNPVKHGFCQTPDQWQFSTIHRP